MKQLIVITFILLSMSTAYAGGQMLLHVYFDTDASITPTNCDGTIDASEGCTLPMIN